MTDVTNQRTPQGPAAVDLEAELLGVMVSAPEVYFELRARLPIQAFYRQSHRNVYAAMGKLAEADESPGDRIRLVDQLEADGLLEATGGAQWITKLWGSAASPYSKWCDRILAHYSLRQVVGVLERAKREAHDPNTDPELLARKLHSATAASLAVNSENWVNARGSVDALLDPELSGTEYGTITPTGFTYLDRLLGGGIRDGASYFLGGLYKMGKSKLALAVAIALVRAGYVVDWYTVEMPHDEITIRALSHISACTEAEVSYRLDQLAGRTEQVGLAPSFAGEKAIDAAVEEWRAINDRFRVYYEGSPYVGDIYAHTQARAIAAQTTGRKVAVFVDYLQECTARLPGVPKNDHRNIAECSSKLNQAAKDAKIPIFILYQLAEYKVLGRQKDGSNFIPVPRAQDGEGSSKIGQSANEIIMVHRPWFELDGDAPLSNFVVLRRGASRSGKNREVYLRAHYGINTVSEWSDALPSPFDK